MFTTAMMTVFAGSAASVGCYGPYVGCYGAYGGGYGGGGNQPVYGLARSISQGQIQVRQLVSTFLTEKRNRTVVRGGRKIVVTYEVVKKEPVFVLTPMPVEPKKLQAMDGRGKKIATETIAALLKEEKPVLITFRGQSIDPVYFRVLKKETLVLVLPPVKESMPRDEEDGALPRDRKAERKEEKPNPKIQLPKSLPPQVALAALGDKGVLRIQQRHKATFVEVVPVKVQVKGKDVVKKFAVTHTSVTVQTKEVDSQAVTVFQEEKKVDRKKIADLLAKETPVFLSLNKQPIDSFYRRLFHKNIVTLAVPSLAAISEVVELPDDPDDGDLPPGRKNRRLSPKR